MNAARTPQYFKSADRLAEAIVEKVGKNIVLALPLGLGKADHIANALFARAVADPAHKSSHLHRADTGSAARQARDRTALRDAIG